MTQGLALDAMAVTLPMGLQPAAREAARKRAERAERACRDTFADRWPASTLEKYAALTHLAVVAVFPGNCYWEGEGKRFPIYNMPKPGTYTFNVVLYRWPDELPGDDSAVWGPAHSLRGADDVELALRLPTRWWRQVHLKGISVVGGHLVLDANWRGDVVDLAVLHQDRHSMKFHALAACVSAALVLGSRSQDVYFQAPWSHR